MWRTREHVNAKRRITMAIVKSAQFVQFKVFFRMPWCQPKLQIFKVSAGVQINPDYPNRDSWKAIHLTYKRDDFNMFCDILIWLLIKICEANRPVKLQVLEYFGKLKLA